jgi:hypothetical protein
MLSQKTADLPRELRRELGVERALAIVEVALAFVLATGECFGGGLTTGRSRLRACDM